MRKNLPVLNLLSVILMVIVSYYSQTIRLNNNTIASVSRDYENLFTPAGYAFSIWGLIYIAYFVYCGYQINNSFRRDNKTAFVDKTGLWFVIANVANAAWVVVWLYEYTWLSVLLMFIILGSLIMIILKTNMERWDAPLKIIAFTWWPICLYAGWITVATIANVAAHLTSLGWKGGILTGEQWTLLMIAITVFINLLIIYKRNMREFAAVGVWALIAIFVKHKDQNAFIAYSALTGGVVVLVYIMYHGYLNRKTNPMYKSLKGVGNID